MFKSTFKKLFLVPVLALSFVAVKPGFAHSSITANQAHHCWCHKSMHDVMGKLELDDAQKEKIKLIERQAHQNKQTMQADFKAVNQKIHHLAQTKDLDEKKLDRLLDQKISIIKAKIKQKIMTEHDIFNVLTQAQQNEFQAIMAKKK